MESSDLLLMPTTLGYLGKSFQKTLISYIINDKIFASEIISDLKPNYFDDPSINKLFTLISNYHTKFESIPNFDVLETIINTNFKDEIEIETYKSITKSIKEWYDEKTKTPDYKNEKEFYLDKTRFFIKQQEFKKAVSASFKILKDGTLEQIPEVQELLSKALVAGEKRDLGVNVFDDPEDVLKDDFRNPIPTLVPGFDLQLNGGPCGGELCMLVAPSGIGKTTLLTRIAHGATEVGKNVLQIIFEDKEKDIQRKHYACQSNIPLSCLSERKEEVLEIIKAKKGDKERGKLIIKKFPEEGTTIPIIKAWMQHFQEKSGIKIDMLVLDYLDCVEAHKDKGDSLKEELVVIKSLMHMISEMDIPCWTASQGNRGSMESKVVAISQIGGTIKKTQKSHCVITLAKDLTQKDSNLANIAFVKCRFAKDGKIFNDCIFDNDKVFISLNTNKELSLAEIEKYENNSSKEVTEQERIKINKILESLKNN